MGKSEIEWTDETWNPVRGCRRVSPGCENCYAEGIAARFSGPGLHSEGLAVMTPNGPRWTGEIRLVPEKLTEPWHWKRPRRIFVNSMSDLFQDGVPNEYIAAVMGVLAAAPQHTGQILTKRAERLPQWFKWLEDHGGNRNVLGCMMASLGAELDAIWAAKDEPLPKGGLWRLASIMDVDEIPLPNVQIGVSVENRRHGLPRIDHLRDISAAVRFLSIEPLLEHLGRINLDGIGWVIAGCESGPRARPFEEDWVRDIRDQCLSAGVPFFYKQAPAKHKGKVVSLPMLDGQVWAEFPKGQI